MTDRKCYKCSAPHNRNTDNLRPYGPQGQDVCFKCAMGTPEDEAAARAQMKAAMDRIPGPAILTSNGPKAPGELAGTDAIPLAAVTHAPPVCSNCGLPFDEHADRDGNRHCPNGKTTFDFVFAINPEALDFVRSNLDKSPEELTRMWIERVRRKARP